MRKPSVVAKKSPGMGDDPVKQVEILRRTGEYFHRYPECRGCDGKVVLLRARSGKNYREFFVRGDLIQDFDKALNRPNLNRHASVGERKT